MGQIWAIGNKWHTCNCPIKFQNRYCNYYSLKYGESSLNFWNQSIWNTVWKWGSLRYTSGNQTEDWVPNFLLTLYLLTQFLNDVIKKCHKSQGIKINAFKSNAWHFRLNNAGYFGKMHEMGLNLLNHLNWSKCSCSTHVTHNSQDSPFLQDIHVGIENLETANSSVVINMPPAIGITVAHGMGLPWPWKCPKDKEKGQVHAWAMVTASINLYL